MGGSLLHYHKLMNVNDLLNKNIQSGNDASDMTIKQNENIISFSIKYKNKITPKDTDILILYETLKKTYINQFKIGLIVKDKKMLLKHKYSNKTKDINVHKPILDEIINNNLLFDELDIIKGIELFKQKFHNFDKET